MATTFAEACEAALGIFPGRVIPPTHWTGGGAFLVMAQLPDDDLGTAFVYIDPKGRVFTGPYPRFMALADGMTLVRPDEVDGDAGS